MGELAKNAIVKTTDGTNIKILDELGRGGQGIVYKVLFNNEQYALKWYWKGLGKERDVFYKNLKHNVDVGSPAKTFLWPLAITDIDSNGCFGYVMELRRPEYVDFPKILCAKVKFSGFEAIVNAALQITTSFKQLHSKGFSYQDLNDGNFFVNPENGDVLICDNDNVAPNGENMGIMGKAGYMAPEILNRDMDNRPDKYSDRFSLAVVLFLLLFRDHPLKGQLEDPDDPFEENVYEIMCKNPVFIFDDKDFSNRPKPNIHVNAIRFWNIYPPFVQNAFKKAFDKSFMKCDGEGKQDRLSEAEWCKTFAWLRNSIVKCTNCGKETFFPMKHPEDKCMCCNKTISRPSTIFLKDSFRKDVTIPLQSGSKIYTYEIDSMADFTTDTIDSVVGEVIENKKSKGFYGIKNLSKDTWYRRTPGGKESICSPGDVLLIAKDNTIKFGTKSEGKIQ